MAQDLNWLNDSDGDTIPDDVSERFSIDLASGVAGREFWSRLLSLTAITGHRTMALPLPLVYPAGEGPSDDGIIQRRIASLSDLDDLANLPEDNNSPDPEQPSVTCLSKLFTIDGALIDRDGDLVADGTRVGFDLPDELPASLGSALANLTARIGLESGGVDLPLLGRGPATFTVRPETSPAAVEMVEDGWLASGMPDDLAALVNKLAAEWPHITVPETAGVEYSLGWLRRALAGDGPEPKAEASLAWELQWSAQWEVDRIWSTFTGQLLRSLDPEKPLQLTIMASENEVIRRSLAKRISQALVRAGFCEPDVRSVCTFKSGLSWLREVVIPDFARQPVERIVISYLPFDRSEGDLDPRTRWLQEMFPGDEILARELNIPLDAIDIVEQPEGTSIFTARAFDASGTEIATREFSPLSRSLPFVSAISDSGTVRVTTSGLIAIQQDERVELPVPSDLETFWTFWQAEIIPRVINQIDECGGPFTDRQPFFDRLEADVWISEPNNRLGVREENDSAAEALHEDIYFNTLDAIEIFGERISGERTSAPGAVLPVVHMTEGQTPHARVRLFTSGNLPDLPYPDLSIRSVRLRDDEFLVDVLVENGSEQTVARLINLAGMRVPAGSTISARVTCGQSSVELRLPLQEVLQGKDRADLQPTMHANIYGDAVIALARQAAAYPEVTAWVEDYSYQGRPLVALSLGQPTPGRLRSPAKASALKPTCLIVARHHANEISSTNAAFQLAHLVATDPNWQELIRRVNIVILPYENPDGAALHARLTGDPEARNWKHHPARYNALGYEFSEAFFNPNTRFGESRVRPAIWRRFLPDAIVDNHGVPSHEWVQPFAGFGSPPRFRVSYWIPQALLYGIVGYVDSEDYPQHQQMAQALRDSVSEAVRETDIGALNDEIGRSYRFWGQERDPERFPGEFHNGMLWHMHGTPTDPDGRGFATRFPATTVLSWVTEVNDETAEGEHLERTARAHLIANRAMLDLLVAAADVPEPSATAGALRWHRARPLDAG